MVLYLAEEEEVLVEGASGLSILGFESVGEAVTPSSEPALLLRLADPLLLALFVGIELHTESSERERPMNFETLPVPCLAASINVPFDLYHRFACIFILVHLYM